MASKRRRAKARPVAKRGRKPSEEKRTNQVRLSLTDAEYAELSTVVEEEELPPAVVARRLLMAAIRSRR